ncbi:TrkA-N domain protein [Thalassoporum mexicanum PCC 7367]|uniref:potassium channel family protein n=1 Tax=Thalassoporum mexicanum TaxID=3457544 RepID=UPI00029F82EF|nr:TrkA family potassium uptake protein [Pseudanabaena sp. PCC 7367]AFY68686.1 TrkA-N domain protein [Pseudanabaena sp. PCC 7367]
MGLSSLNFFRSIQNQTRQEFAVIGLGRFGRAVSSTLLRLGAEVLAVDQNETRVCQMLKADMATHCLRLDSTDPFALKEAGIFDFDTVIVAIGNYLEQSIITTLNLKEAGVNNVVAKASSEVHGTLLKKVGADLVVYPESEMGCSLARSLTQRGILDRFELDQENSIVEIMVPDEFHEKTILELKLRSKYGITVLAVSDDIKTHKYEINPDPYHRLQRNTAIVVIGSNSDIRKLPVENSVCI